MRSSLQKHVRGKKAKTYHHIFLVTSPNKRLGLKANKTELEKEREARNISFDNQLTGSDAKIETPKNE
jgi:thiamine pyrophosphokinase